MIRENLAGRRLLVTGSTGFLGTAIVERLLRAVPDCEIVLLVRPGRRSTVERRVQREILKNTAFDRLRREWGDEFDEIAARRITSVAGDVSTDGLGLDDEGRALLASCDTVIHSAATVSFDSPLDGAVEVNLLGPRRIALTLQDLGVTPHLVAVSTCYVAGNRRGVAPEEHVGDSDFFLDIDWRAEVDAARRARSDADAESRQPDRLAEFAKRAHAELGAAGTPLLADKTEQLRVRWVSDRMTDLGRSRATSLGWPDVYAYTKSLGERALLESRGDVPVSIVRPSIIESSYAEPFPGWIRGFRMAEPVIISFARGLLKEFPGVPEGIVDVIPVDLVVATIIAVAARGPEDEPGVVQVASGSANPLRYRRLVDTATEWFTEHPLYDSHDQPIKIPDWSYGGRGGVVDQLRRAKNTLEKAERALSALPLRGKQAEWSASVEEKREEAERALGYVELYGAYAECEAVYEVDRLLALWDSLDATDQAEFAFDPRIIDWDHYIRDTHLPSVVEHARAKTAPSGRSSTQREDRLRGQVLSPDRHLAAFDLENTLIASNVVASYAWLASRRLPPDDRARFVVKTLLEAPQLLKLDRKDRSDFLRHFYRRYEGAPVDQIDDDSIDMFNHFILTKSFPAGIRRVREHRRLGHRTVLITGALDFVVQPLAPLFDDIVCAHLTVRRNRYTGELDDVPPTGETRAQAMADYAAAEGLELSQSVAYADSSSDLPMLEAVGFPVAVNPETRLASIARKRGWLVEQFDKAPGGPRRALRWRRRAGPSARSCGDDGDDRMKALVYERNVPRYAAARAAGSLVAGLGAKVGPLRLKDVDPPDQPGPDWVRVRPRLTGICGSDLSTIDGTSSRYFEPIVSFPFVPGHEVVGELDDGSRVVLEPVLGCATRGIDPPCAACARGDLGNCERITFGDLEPGLQTGFCADTGGGWSTLMVAHPTQLHPVPASMTDEAAVMIEPTACAVHGALVAARAEPVNVVVLGAGTLGLLTVAAVRRHLDPVQLVVAAKHPAQQVLARELGADLVVTPGEVRRTVRRMAATLAIGDGHVERLTGGADVVIDCVGSADSLVESLDIVRPRGRIVLLGMPGTVSVDLTGLWQREVELVGAYTYGTETLADGRRARTFDLATELVDEADLGRLVSATYPLDDYERAIEHAAHAGPRGAVKIAFDLRDEKERDRL